MIDNKFKKLMIECPRVVRKAVLTDHQIKVFKYVYDEGHVYSTCVAKRFGISVQSANGVLSKLNSAGYVERLRVEDPAGGYRYVYQQCVYTDEGL